MKAGETDGGEEVPATADAPPADTRSLVALAFGFVGVLAIISLIFFTHRERRLVELQDQHARAAAHLAKEVELKLANYRAMVDNTTRITNADAERSEAARSDASAASSGDLVSAFGIRVLPSYVERIQQNCVLSLDRSQVALCAAQQIAEVVGTRQQGLEIVACPASVKRGESAVLLSDDSASLILPPREGPDQPVACGKLKLARLMARSEKAGQTHASAASAGGFEHVFLLDATGEALFPSRDAGAPPVESESALRLLVFPDFDPKRARASLMLTQIPLGPEKYRAFLQPVGVSYRRNAEGSAVQRGFFVAGVLPEKQLFFDSVKVSPIASLLAVLLVAFGALALPLAKLWFLSAKARFRRLHVGLLVTSALLTTLLGTVLVLAAVAHNRLATRLDHQLETVGKRFAESFGRRVSNASGALDAFAQAPAVSEVVKAVPSSDAVLEATCTQAGGRVGFAPFDGEQKLVPVCEATGFDFGQGRDGWSIAFLTDQRGFQRAKFVPGKHATQPVSLSDRGYFQRALALSRRCREASEEPCTPPAAAQVVRSLTTGELVLIVARAVVAANERGAATDEPNVIGAVETRLDEFARPVLPLGFRAMVVDAAGRIMIDSKNQAEPGQTLLDDVDRPGTLTAMLNAGIPGMTDVGYLGVPSRARVLPVVNTDFMVLSIAPRALVDLPVTNSVLVTLFGVGTVVAALLLVLAAAVPLSRVANLVRTGRLQQERPPSLRPHADESAAYAEAGMWMIGACILLCGVALLDVQTMPLVPMLALVLGAGAYGLWSVPGIGKYGPWGEPTFKTATAWRGWVQRRLSRLTQRQIRDWREYLPFSYALCCFGLASVLVVAPATVVFMGAYDTVTEHLVRSEQDHYVRELQGRTDCLPGFSEEPCPEVYGSGAEVVSETSSERPLSSCWFRPMGCFLELLPLLDVTPDRRDALLFRVDRSLARAAALPVRAWTRAPDVVELHFPGQNQRFLQSRVPRLLSREYAPIALLVILLATVAAVSAAHVLCFQSLRRLLFLEALLEQRSAGMRSPNALFDWKPLEHAGSPGRLGLLSPPEELGRELAEDSRFVNALADPPIEADETQTWLIRDGAGTLLEGSVPPGVERALESDRPVVLLSAREPPSSGAAAPASAAGRDWARALERFEFVRVGAAVFSDANPKELESAWAALSPDAQRVLGQIALDDYAAPHPANAEALKDLASRGLLEPSTFRLVSEPLRQFVLEAIPGKQYKEWSLADKSSVWGAIRWPLSTGVAALLALLAISQPELAAAGAVMPTLAAGVPALLKILSGALQR